jgi:hypothetical protein
MTSTYDDERCDDGVVHDLDVDLPSFLLIALYHCIYHIIVLPEIIICTPTSLLGSDETLSDVVLLDRSFVVVCCWD